MSRKIKVDIVPILASMFSIILIIIISTVVFTQAKGPVRKPQSKPLSYAYLNKVVRLTADGDTFCSGVIIGKHHVATAYHCLGRLTPNPLDLLLGKLPKAEVRPADDSPTGIILSLKDVIVGSQQMDTAVLSGNFANFEVQPLTLSLDSFYQLTTPGTYVTLCGFPLGEAVFCQRLPIRGRYFFQVQVDGQVFPGMSGGPGFLDDGTVISVTSAMVESMALISPLVALPITVFK